MTVNARNVGRTLRAYGVRVDAELRTVVLAAGALTATLAQANHPYRDRTGTLSASIEGLPAVGSAMGGTLMGGAAAGADYASYLEASVTWAFMAPAWQQVEPLLEHNADLALGRAWEDG